MFVLRLDFEGITSPHLNQESFTHLAGEWIPLGGDYIHLELGWVR